MIGWRRLRLTHRAGLLAAGLLVSCSATATLISIRHFRTALYQQEYRSAFTVYVAAANYLVGHYKSRDDTFSTAALDFVIGQRFLVMEGKAAGDITHRPSQLLLYDADGQLIYAYAPDASNAIPTRAVAPDGYQQTPGASPETIEIRGPLSPSGDVPGFVTITFPSTVGRHVSALQRRVWLISGVVIALAILLALILTRRTLQAVEDLTRAATRVSHGNLQPSRIDGGHGEIADLVDTFNDMVASLNVKQREAAEINAMLEHQVEARTRELKVANDELRSFAYTVSHDLRAPLRAMDFVCQQLDDPESDIDPIEAVARIRRNVGRMGQLIEGILMLSRAQRQDLVRESVDMTAIAEGLIRSQRDSEPNHVITVTIAPGMTTQGDRQFLTILLQNLLSNAWKFSHQTASPKVTFDHRETAGQSIFCIRDNGAGFDMAHAGNLFEPFKRLHTAREFVGTGVGLATARRIVERHGGRIWAESKPGEGAAFFFTLDGAGGPTDTSEKPAG
ncbi:MAG: ATP-binding protein [Verrucomicrobia bacterium]|nr:ATP-binding protein [Verrucomicrobiota bacterium]